MAWANPHELDLKIGLEGRAWDGPSGEAHSRHDLLNELRLEMSGGKLFFRDNERLLLVALLAENLGAAAIVSLGDPAVWREAVARLD